MTDEAFVFNQDIRERSKMKTGAIHKKNGSKSRKCTLPSDSLTPSQKKKLNGEVISINMSAPYTDWKSFRHFNIDLQQEYLTNLVQSYGARKIDIADMFGIPVGTLASHIRNHSIKVRFLRGGREVHNINDCWLDFITKPSSNEVVEAKSDEEILKERFDISIPESEKTVEESVVKEEPIDPEPIKETCIFQPMISMNLVLNGQRSQILKMLETILGDDNEYKMVIDISSVSRLEGYAE